MPRPGVKWSQLRTDEPTDTKRRLCKLWIARLATRCRQPASSPTTMRRRQASRGRPAIWLATTMASRKIQISAPKTLAAGIARKSSKTFAYVNVQKCSQRTKTARGCAKSCSRYLLESRRRRDVGVVDWPPAEARSSASASNRSPVEGSYRRADDRRNQGKVASRAEPDDIIRHYRCSCEVQIFATGIRC